MILESRGQKEGDHGKGLYQILRGSRRWRFWSTIPRKSSDKWAFRSYVSIFHESVYHNPQNIKKKLDKIVHGTQKERAIEMKWQGFRNSNFNRISAMSHTKLSLAQKIWLMQSKPDIWVIYWPILLFFGL